MTVIIVLCDTSSGLFPKWKVQDAKKADEAINEAMDIAEKYLGVPQVNNHRGVCLICIITRFDFINQILRTTINIISVCLATNTLYLPY